MNLDKLFDASYMFERFPTAGFSWPIRIVLLIIFIASIILALYANKQIIKKGPHRRLWRKIQVWSWTNGLVGLLEK